MSTAEVATSGTQVRDLVALISEEEPVELRIGLRRESGENPAAGKAASVDAVSATLWSSWSDELVPRGVDTVGFRAVVEGADHEVWLWVMGDRPYAQLVATIAGRVLRRSRDTTLDA